MSLMPEVSVERSAKDRAEYGSEDRACKRDTRSAFKAFAGSKDVVSTHVSVVVTVSKVTAWVSCDCLESRRRFWVENRWLEEPTGAASVVERERRRTSTAPVRASSGRRICLDVFDFLTEIEVAITLRPAPVKESSCTGSGL